MAPPIYTGRSPGARREAVEMDAGSEAGMTGSRGRLGHIQAIARLKAKVSFRLADLHRVMGSQSFRHFPVDPAKPSAALGLAESCI